MINQGQAIDEAMGAFNTKRKIARRQRQETARDGKMERKRRLRQQIIKVENYGTDWINRLAVIGDRFEAMDGAHEQAAALRWLLSKYGDNLKN